MRLIQLSHPDHTRRITRVKGTELELIEDLYPSCYDLFAVLIEEQETPNTFIEKGVTEKRLDYDKVYNGETDWKILSSFDHPEDPRFCTLSGKGLTHKAIDRRCISRLHLRRGISLTVWRSIFGEKRVKSPGPEQ